MFKNYTLHFCLVACGLLALTRPGAAGALTTENLLINGDAELQRCSNDWTAQSSIPGWQVLRGAAVVLCYTAFDLAAEKPALPAGPAAGRALFAAPGADTAMEQTVDVGAAAAGIDDGKVGFTASAWLGGWRDRPERAILTVLFLDSRGRSTGSPRVIASADARARKSVTGLVQRTAEGPVPPGTRRINVTVQFLSGMTSFNNAYADNIRLTLNGEVSTLRPAAAEPPAAHIPALDHVYVLMMENTNYSDVIHTTEHGVTVDPQMPFTAALARRGVILSNMWGTYHPSDQNYVAMVAGDTFRYGLTYYPDYDLPATHLGDLLNQRGKSWRAYVQAMKTPCNLLFQGSGQDAYAPDDQPFVQFQNVTGDLPRCIADVRDLTDLNRDIAAGTLPDFAWIAADNWWDGEGAWYEAYDVAYSNAKQDQFIREALQPLLESAQWNESRSLLILTWDESGGWGWPDNRVPTILVGSPGLLREGTVSAAHVDGYDLLRTIESGLQVGTLGRFDQFAEPLNAIFAHGDEQREQRARAELWPAPTVATRGSIADTFGQATTPAAVDRGQPLTLVVPGGVEDGTLVNVEPLGEVPTDASTAYHFADDHLSVTIPTGEFAPGLYGAWLRRGAAPPHRAPMMAIILPTPQVDPRSAGVEIVGAAVSGGDPANVSIREGSNFIVRYCLPAGVSAPQSWIGIFAAGTPGDQLTKDNANVIGFWLRTPGRTGGEACGEADAFASELAPGQKYQVFLRYDTPQGGSKTVGRSAAFTLTPALPH